MPKVDELITDIAKGGLKLPEFQRGYVWKVGVTALLQSAEGQRLEFKSSLRWDHDKGYTNRALEAVAVKTIAGFLNADKLLIGVDDSVASRCVELLQAELDCIRWPGVLADFGPGGVSQCPGGQDRKQVA